MGSAILNDMKWKYEIFITICVLKGLFNHSNTSVQCSQMNDPKRVGGVVKVNKVWIFRKKWVEDLVSDLFWNLEDFPRSWEQPRWKDCTRSAAAVTTFNSCVKTTCYCFPPPPPPCPRSRPSTAEANIIPKHFQTPLPSYDREIPSKSKIVEQQQTNPSVQNISYKCFHRTSALEVLVATESVWSCFLTLSWQKIG